jgi:hypothetical protein
LLNIPHRHDLDGNSVINQEIRLFNRKLNKIAKVFSHVTVLENDLNRKYYTQHGMHLNKWGKEQLSKQIASLINNPLNWRPEKVPVLALDWKTYSAHTQNMERLPTELRPESAQDSSCQIATTSNEDTVCRTSNRQRRIPITRNNDFLWKVLLQTA